MNFPSSARYGKVMWTVKLFFSREGIVEFPVDPLAVIKRNQWGVVTYSELAAIHGKSLSDVVSAFQSEDGFTTYGANGYTIAYNDTVGSISRIRFTLMHEIGHIYLGHLIDFRETILRRSTLSREKYRVLENETNCFARNTLSPAPIVTGLGLSRETDLMQVFKISRKAATARLKFLRWDLATPLNALCAQAGGFIEAVLHTKHCSKCKHCFISTSATYCPICGSDDLKRRKDEVVMIYDGFDLDEHGMPEVCPRCDNEQLDGKYCKVCGVEVANRCTYDYCGAIADGNARFCTSCGSITTYFENDLLKSWEEVKEQRELEAIFE